MVNYILSFCKITGASKTFARSFYLPLLKPLTPREALRTLRITGKWLLGAKIQHYMPVLQDHTKKRSKKSKDYGKIVHEKNSDDYVYMAPVLDPENDNHKLLLEVLAEKKNGNNFVYTVDDKKYNIVLQGQLESAIRSGEIVDILVSQNSDKMIIKLKSLKKIPVSLQFFESCDENLYKGEGATTAELEKFHHHGKYTMGLAKMFEEKELKEERWEQELKKIMKRRKKRKWEHSRAYKEMMKRNMRNMNWKKFEEDAKKVIDEISEPAVEKPIEMEIDDLESTRNVNETILRGGQEMLNQLPTLNEIPDVIQNLGSASLHEIEDAEDLRNLPERKRRVSGVRVKLPSGKECFVSGQMVRTEDGEVFVPGQTVNNHFGDEYAPGITINIDNKPTLVGGLIMGEEKKDPMFLPSQSTITADGQLTFASAPEERPPPIPENEKKVKKRKKTIIPPSPVVEMPEPFTDDLEVIFDENTNEDLSSEDKSLTEEESSIELNNSELEELDIEAIALKQQRQAELDKLKQILLDDGMDDIIASLEDKKAQLNKKLEELRKLSMNSEDTLVSYVTESDSTEVASKITSNKDAIIRISDILLTMTRKAASLRDKNSIRAENIQESQLGNNPTDIDRKFHKLSQKLRVLFKTALVQANNVFKSRPKDQILALSSIEEILVEPLGSDTKLLDEFLNLTIDRNELCHSAFKELSQKAEDSKLTKLRMMLNNDLSVQDVLEYLSQILEPDSLMNTSFSKIIKTNNELVLKMRENLKNAIKNIKTDEEALETLEKSIVKTIKDSLKENYEELLKDQPDDLNELIKEASSFAKALDLDEIVYDLTKLSSNTENIEETSKDMLKRMILIRKLAERDYSLKTAITRIKKNPEIAQTDPRIRQLLRESGVLISDLSRLRNSRDVPMQLLRRQNLLAIEDYLIRKSKIDKPVLISRGTFQAVVPKDSARGVLAGRVAYVLVDESGVTNFKPMHMMNAVQVNKNREKRIDDYLTGARDSSSDRQEARTYLQAKNNGSDTNRRTMSSRPPLYRGYEGPRA